jgi:hypothetical protein
MLFCRGTFTIFCRLAIGLVFTTCFVFAQQVPLAQHVILVIEENTSYSTVLGPPVTMPWLVSQGTLYGYSKNYYSNTADLCWTICGWLRVARN